MKFKEYVPFVLVGILVVLSFLLVKPLLTAILVGGLLAYVCYRLYVFVLSKIKNKTASALIVCFAVLLIVVTVGGFLVNTLISESYSLFVLGKQKLATGIFQDCSGSLCQKIENIAQDPEITFHIQQILKASTNWVIEKGSEMLLSLPWLILNLFVVFFTMFYFLKDGEEFLRKSNEFLSMQQRKYDFILQRLKEIIHGVVYGYLVIALLQGTIGAFGFWIFGIPSPVFWGVAMTVLSLIPFLGTGVVWVPASALLLLDGIFSGSTVLIARGIGLSAYSLFFVSSLDNVFRPKIVGKKAKVHPAIILLGIFGGLLYFGPLGVLFGPLILSMAYVLVNVYILQKSS